MMKKLTETSPYIPLTEYPRTPDLEMGVRIFLGRGIFERTSFKKFMSYIPGRQSVVEVGSHVGSWTLGFARLFNRVVGFEPHPVNRAYLLKNIERARTPGRVEVYPYAVTDNLSAEFSISANGATRNSGMAHLIPREVANDNTPSVTCVRLDDVLKTHFTPAASLDALKVDVEGMELNVLKSGQSLIREFKPTILLEINRHCARYGHSVEEIYDHMSDLGYREADRTRNDHIFVWK